VETFLYFPAVVDAGVDVTIPTGESTTLSANVNPTGNYTYSWTPTPDAGGTTLAPIVTPSVTSVYYLTVTTEYGCKSSDSVKVTLDLNLVELFIPNMITPNGDGFNDKFEIKKLPLFPKNSLAILNRNGQVIFTMDDYDNTWEGDYKGNLMPDGTYYYVLKVTVGSNEKEFKGPINVLRSK
jgi:gliding motility-associated-like protein